MPGRNIVVIYANEMAWGQFPCKCALMRGSEPFMNHCHSEVEIIKIREGRLRVVSEGENYLLRAGDIWIAPPFASHSIEGGSEDSVRLVVLMESKLMGMGEYGGEQWQEPSGPAEDVRPHWLDVQGFLEQADLNSRNWDGETRVRTDAVIEEIYQEYLGKEYGWQLAVKALADQLLLLVVRDMPRCEKKPLNTQVQKLKGILEYIARNYCGPITLSGCAQVAGFNPTYFSRYFKGHMGITFQEYVKKLRIDRAKWLLQADSGPVTEVCYQCGYQDIKTFNKLFRQETGMSPTQFRKEQYKM